MNDMQTLEMTIPKFCIGENPSTINPLSSYNLGWFPKDYTDIYIVNIDENSYYNISNSYDVVYDDPNYIFVENNTKYYFIFPECPQDWIKEVEPCIDGVRLISYRDVNYCNSYSTIPSDNSTNEYCGINEENNSSEELLAIIIICFFIVIAMIGGIAIHEGFFGLVALLLALLMTIFIYYHYSAILIVASGFMILLFAIMWIVIGRHKR
jgi:hypothetical protein